MTVPTRKMPGFRNVEGKNRLNRRAAKLIREHHGEVRKYSDLPREAQLALAHYMSIDGEAWNLAPGLSEVIARHIGHLRGDKRDTRTTVTWNRAFARFLPFYVEQYGNFDFGYIPALPLLALIESCMKDTELAADWPGGEGWKQYHAWYMGKSHGGPSPKHDASARNPWPVILSSFDDETLQDGWTRFHQYCEQGLVTCPAVWFPRQHSRSGRIQP